MTQQAKIQVGDTIQFNAGSKVTGQAVVVSIIHKQVKIWYDLVFKGGKDDGKAFKYWVRMPKTIDAFATKVESNKEVAKAATEAVLDKVREKHDRLNESYNTMTHNDIKPGCIITYKVKGKYGQTRFKVFEYDYNKGRVKGFSTAVTNPGSRMGWVMLGHPDIELIAVEQNAFDPMTDEVGQAHEERRERSRTKRATRRAIRDSFY